jgi:hypothetical protein
VACGRPAHDMRQVVRQPGGGDKGQHGALFSAPCARDRRHRFRSANSLIAVR